MDNVEGDGNRISEEKPEEDSVSEGDASGVEPAQTFLYTVRANVK